MSTAHTPFIQQLQNAWQANNSLLCVGLDPTPEKLPTHLRALPVEQAFYEFCIGIIDATAAHACSFKPQIAYFAAHRSESVLEDLIRYAKANYPHIPVILDAKRGDIGNTSKMYAQTFFEEYNIDSVTVAPYMGEDSVKPFLEYDGKWVILLALTSNKGSHDFQLTEDKEGERLFEKVLKKSQEWGNDENMMYVVGATQGKMFEDIRKVAPNHFLLVPGVGAQGGSLQEVCKYGIIKDCGLLVNSSRGIIYASNGDDFAEVAGQKAKELQAEMAAELAKL